VKVTATQRYARDVEGMPCYAAAASFMAVLLPENMKGSIPRDDRNCAIALGCRNQLGTPYVSVGRRRTLLALPHPQGVIQPGYGKRKWAVFKFENSPAAMRVIIAADTESLDIEDGVQVDLRPPRKTDRPGRKRSGRANGSGRKLKGHGQDRLTVMGVRNLNGQRTR